MSTFGWSLPPGCRALPSEAAGHALDLTGLVSPTGDTRAVFWDEHGGIHESFDVQVSGNEAAGVPTNTETDTRLIGEHPWADECSKEENMRRAADHYRQLKGIAV